MLALSSTILSARAHARVCVSAEMVGFVSFRHFFLLRFFPQYFFFFFNFS